MTGYFVSASITCAQVRPKRLSRGGVMDLLQFWSESTSTVVSAETSDTARKLFTESLGVQAAGEKPRAIKIHEASAVELVGELLTENGSAPLDWPHMVRQAWADVQSLPPGFMEEGNWLDQASIDGIAATAFNLDSFQLTLPEDIRSSLNWADDKQFYFLFTVLSPSAPPAEIWIDPKAEMAEEANVVTESNEAGPDRFLDSEPYPRLLPVDTAFFVRARNSAEAVWLWRKYAAGTSLRENPIRMVPWLGTIMGVPVELPSAEPSAAR